MQYKFTIAALLILLTGALAGCGGGGHTGDACNDAFNPVVNAKPTSTVGQNDTLQLSVFGVEGSNKYNWTGPNGFTSHDKNPIVTGLVKGKDEVYTVEIVTNGGCVYTSSSSPITIIGPWNPCGLDSNQVSLANVTQMSVGGGVGSTGTSDYMIMSRSSSAYITVEFPNNTPPAEGIYTISNTAAALPNGRARVVIVTDKTFSTSPGKIWTPTSGSVYVSVDNSVTTISFCNLTFTCPDYTSTSLGGANLKWRP